MQYDLDGLISANLSYHHEHRVTESDVQKANALVQAIEASRNSTAPQPGDIIQYTTKHGDFYARAHIEGLTDDGKLSICEQPYIPFVLVDNGRVRTNTSGGAWAAVPAQLEFVGPSRKSFKAWGHCGPCGNGTFQVLAQVNVWRYTDGNPEFTTEHHDMYYATHLDHPDGYGYIYHVSKGYSTPYTAFRTDAEYQEWLNQVGGIERPAAWPSSRLVWAKKAETNKAS